MTKYNEFGFREDYDPKNKIVKQDKITIDNDEYFISTVDLGMNHSFIEGLELFYETMIFKNGDYSGIYQNRYETREQALYNHKLIIENMKCLYGYKDE